MAKRRTAAEKAADVANGNGDKGTRAQGFREHHADMKAAGHVLTFDSRPRQQPYKLEEWMTPSRQFVIVKVYDDGRMVRFTEAASTTDAKETAASMK